MADRLSQVFLQRNAGKSAYHKRGQESLPFRFGQINGHMFRHLQNFLYAIPSPRHTKGMIVSFHHGSVKSLTLLVILIILYQFFLQFLLKSPLTNHFSEFIGKSTQTKPVNFRKSSGTNLKILIIFVFLHSYCQKMDGFSCFFRHLFPCITLQTKVLKVIFHISIQSFLQFFVLGQIQLLSSSRIPPAASLAAFSTSES